MAGNPVPAILPFSDDAFRLSRENLLVVVFAKVRSPYYGLALNIARGAERYLESVAPGLEIHTAVFSRTPEQAQRASALLAYIHGWATTQLFFGGRREQNYYAIETTLSCYQRAMACDDHRAHCVSVETEPFINRQQPGPIVIKLELSNSDREASIPPRQLRFYYPCTRLSGRYRLERDHPATWADQLQAAAVSELVDWCPCFNKSMFRQIE